MSLPRFFSGTLVFFATDDALKTTGFLMDAEDEDAVLIMHGMGGTFYKDGFLEGARELVSRGVSVLTFNNRGADIVKDFRDLRGEHHTLGTAFERFEDVVSDLNGAIKFLHEQGYRRIHLIGHSTGCQKILYYVWKFQNPTIKSLIHLAPAEDYEIWRNALGDEFPRMISIAKEMISSGKGDKLHIPLYEKTGELWSASRFLSFASRSTMEGKMFNYENLENFSQITLPMQIFIGTDDPYFFKPLNYYVKRLQESYRGKKLDIEIVPNADHSFHGMEREIFRKIGEFVNTV